MKTAIYTYAWDYLDEGSDNVLDRFNDAGINGVYVALKYHTAQEVLPHNPNHKVIFPRPGAIYYKHDPKLYANSLIKPIVSPIIEDLDFDVMKVLRTKTRERNMGLYAWLLGYHSTAFGQIYPSASITNLFGDKLQHSQCPSNPDMMEYLINTVRDITSNYDIDKILFESVESLGIYHGFHHEMTGIPLTPLIQFFLSLCFCPNCIEYAEKRNIDVEGLKLQAKKIVEEFFDSGKLPENENWQYIRNICNGDMGKYLDMRQDINADVHKNIRSEIKKHSGCEIAVLDFGPLAYSYSLGPDDSSWENGVNLQKISGFADYIVPTFYHDNQEDLLPKFKEFKLMLKGKAKIGIALDAVVMPESTAPKDLGKALPVSINMFKGNPEIAELSFYNYSLMRTSTLDLIKKLMK
jgi:hypothetical protein